jgi:hypothetical protein
MTALNNKKLEEALVLNDEIKALKNILNQKIHSNLDEAEVYINDF